MGFISRIVITLALLISASHSQDSGGNCFSLNSSQTCPAFQQYYISTSLNSTYPFLSNITNVQSFDSAMLTYVDSSAFYLSKLGCTNKASISSIPYARYSLTFLCATLIQDSSYSLPCNYDNGLNPPPLCQSTCFEWTDSVNSITNNVDMCPNQDYQEMSMENLNSSCIYWSGLNGTYNCINGMANEPTNCGFASSSEGCSYCKSSPDDSCCQELTGCRSLSVGAIIGIIIGSLAFVGIVGAAVFFFCCRRNKRNNVSFGGGRYKNSSNSNNIGSSSNNILGVVASKIKKNNNNSRASLHEIHDGSSVLGGYESLASQRHLVSGQNNYSNESPSRKTPPPLPPPLNTTSLDHSDDMLPSSSGPVPPMEEFYEVKHPYPPQMGDELGLHVGDIVCVAMNFDDGWALGFNVTTGLKGVFPLVCVAPAPEEVLEQLLQPSDPQDYSNKTLVEDGGHYGAHYNSYNSQNSITMQQIRENLRRSLSISSRNTHNTLPTTELTHHSSIPRRTASIMRNSYGYHEADSPTSPTLNTPFFDVTLLSNNPSSEQHRINPPIETIELHRANNRVSKLEESD